MTWLLGLFSSVVILSWLLPTKETERLLLRRNCFSKDSANSWMEFDLVSGHELSAEGVLLAFLWQWHLTSWSSWNSLEPLRWPEEEPLAEAWSRVVWRAESLAWKTKDLCSVMNIKAEHTRQNFFSATETLQTVVQSEGPCPEFCIFFFTCRRIILPRTCFLKAAEAEFPIIPGFEDLSFGKQMNISNVKCAGSS